MPLSDLPPETLLDIFSHLPLESLAVSLRVCTDWFLLISAHSQRLYRDVLRLEDLDNSEVGSGGSEEVDEKDWREGCRRAKVLKTNRRHARGTSEWLMNPGRDAWRVKLGLDDTLIMTTGAGGLYVLDVQTNEVLSHLPHVQPYAHVEFDQGFIIFSGNGGRSHEVYRQEQRDIVHFATLTCPRLPRASRFIFPHLLIGSMDAQSAWLWDVPKKQIVATIDISHPRSQLISYVDFTSSHIFILSDRSMSTWTIPTLPTLKPLSPIRTSNPLNFPSVRPCATARCPARDLPEPPSNTSRRRLKNSTAQVAPGDSKSDWPRSRIGLLGGDGYETLVAERTAQLKGGVVARDFWDMILGHDLGFTAVHPSGPNLFLTGAVGVHIVFGFEEVLVRPELESQRTVLLASLDPVLNLCCSDRGAAFTTDETVFWISNDDLPTHNDIATLQQGSTSLSLIVRQFQDVSTHAAHRCSSLQMDDSKIVMVYEAGHDEYNDRPGYPPSQAWSGQQRVVKVFNFEPDEAVQASAEVQVQTRMIERMRGRD